MKRNKVKKIVLLIFVGLSVTLGVTRYRQTKSIKIGIFTGSTWDVPNPDSYTVIDHAIASYRELHPDVTIEYISGIQESDYSSWLAEQIVEGKEPDVYMVLQNDFDYLASIGALENLDRYLLVESDFDLNQYYLSSINAGKHKESYYALPYLSNPTLMFVNTTLLEEHNIKVPSHNWSTNDFYNICSTISQNSENQFGYYNYSWYNLVNAKGIQLIDGDGFSSGFSTDDMNDVFMYMKRLDSLNKNYRVSAQDYDEGNVAFYPLSYAQYRTYKSYPYQVQKYSNFSWGCLTMPQDSEVEPINENSTILIGMSSRSRNKDAAWDFLKYLSYNPDVQIDVMKYSQGISPLRNVTNSKEVAEFINKDAPSAIVDTELLNLVMDKARSQNTFQKFQEIKSLIDNECRELIENNEDVYFFSNSVQKKVKLLLNE